MLPSSHVTEATPLKACAPTAVAAREMDVDVTLIAMEHRKLRRRWRGFRTRSPIGTTLCTLLIIWGMPLLLLNANINQIPLCTKQSLLFGLFRDTARIGPCQMSYSIENRTESVMNESSTNHNREENVNNDDSEWQLQCNPSDKDAELVFSDPSRDSLIKIASSRYRASSMHCRLPRPLGRRPGCR